MGLSTKSHFDCRWRRSRSRELITLRAVFTPSEVDLLLDFIDDGNRAQQGDLVGGVDVRTESIGLTGGIAPVWSIEPIDRQNLGGPLDWRNLKPSFFLTTRNCLLISSKNWWTRTWWTRTWLLISSKNWFWVAGIVLTWFFRLYLNTTIRLFKSFL